MDHFFFPPLGVFGFVVILVLIGSLFQYLKVRSNNETIRTLAQSGQPIDPRLLGRLGRDDNDGPSGLFIGGLVTLAAAVGLYFFGAQLGLATGDEEVGPVLRAVAMIPGAVGIALLLGGVISLLVRKRDSDG